MNRRSAMNRRQKKGDYTMVKDSRNPGINVGDTVSGYRVERVGRIAEIHSQFYVLEHPGAGARHFHISNPDTENTFGVAFKTVPTDSTGVAHILEHTVLCGSAKYPVRDPFFSMLKRSLSTFMNAFTASDWTMYPFSTENRKDYYNLMEVYLDAAFFPRLDELSFKQEGHRLEIEADPEHPDREKLVYKGVVYNEMKGAMSSPDQVMVRSLMNALYPDTTYRHNSGGEPAVIPSLTYAQLRAFHRRHYHPSNAFFYTYGNLPLRDHLAFISEKVLRSFQPIDPDTHVKTQPRWPAPKRVVYPYPLGRNENPEKKYQVCVGWLTADIRDSFQVLVMSLIGHILLGNAASPLRKALIDSKLGSSLSDGTGYDSDNRDTMFVCGLKDVRKSDADAVESIIFQVLKTLVAEGIDKTLIESAIHQIEFHRKEVTNTPYPYGIKLLMTFAGSWLHGGDPERILNLDQDLDRLRLELDRGPFLEEKIRTELLENPHRVRFILEPDQEMADQQARDTAAALETLKNGMDDQAMAAVRQDGAALVRRQETGENITCLPTLELADIPPAVKRVAPSRTAGETVCFDQPTSGICYLAAAAGIAALDPSRVSLLPFFCHAVSRVGTRGRDYTEMARRIDAYTGGVGFGANARVAYDGSGACIPFVSFNGKCLGRNQEKMFSIARELLTQYDFSDRVRLKSLLLEYRAGLESMVVHNGHRLAMSLASRNFSTADALSEAWHGVHQLQFIKALTEGLTDGTLKTLSEDLAAIGQTVFLPQNLKMTLIGEDAAVDRGLGLFEKYPDLSAMRCPLTASRGFAPPQVMLPEAVPREGWITAASVAFVASAFETVPMGHADAPALAAAAKLLRSLYLHREIREKGGAYGGFAVYNAETGMFCFGSYRDPHIVSTLGVYDRASDFIRSGAYTDEDIKEAVLQVCSEIDKPDPPGPAARKAFYRMILSLSDDRREHFKNMLLQLDRRRMAEVADKYFGPEPTKAVAVIAGQTQMEAAGEKLADHPLTLHTL